MNLKTEIPGQPKLGLLVAIDENGDYLYKAVDVARIIGYKRPHAAVKRLCKNPVKLMAPMCNQYGGAYSIPMLFIDPEDLCRMVTESTLPAAKEARKEMETLRQERAKKRQKYVFKFV